MTWTEFRLGATHVDLGRQVVVRGGAELRLSPLEARLLGHLAAHAGQLVGRDALLTEVWGYRPGVVTRAVDHTVRRLRKKVEEDASAPVFLQSVYGGGYVLEGLAPVAAAGAAEAVELVGRDALVRAHGPGASAGPGVRTLVGPPGVGKSALAGVLAGPGAARVDLSAATTAAAAWEALGEALSVEGPEAAVREGLRHRAVSLVVEGARADAPDALAAVARWGRWARVFVATRAPLALPGARRVSVPPLDAAAALALLSARAAAHGPFPADALQALAARLGGLPLAIELAAARLGTLTPSELAARLAARLDVLAARDPRRPPEHRSLRALLEHAWAELDADEQAGLCALHHLGARFPADAAEAALGGARGALVLDALVARGLVRRAVDGGRSRLWLDPAVRAWAAEQARGRPDQPAVSRRLVAWARGRCPSPFAALTSGLAAARPALEALLDAAARPDDRLVLAVGLAPAWRATGALARLDRALEEAAAGAPDHPWAHPARLWRAEALLALGRGDQAAALLEVVLADATGRVRAEAQSLRGTQALQGGRLADAAADLRAALATAEDEGWEGLAARTRCELGVVGRYSGDAGAAVALHLEAARIQRERGERVGAARSLGRAGLALRDRGELAEAEVHLLAAVADLEAAGAAQPLASTRMNLGAVRSQRGAHAAAEEAYRAALEGHQVAGNRRGEAACRLNLGLSHLHRGEGAQARASLHAAVALADAVGVPRYSAAAAAVLGVSWLLDDDPGAAAAALDEAVPRLEACGYPAAVARYGAWARVARAAAGRPAGPPPPPDAGAASFQALAQAVVDALVEPTPGALDRALEAADPDDEDAALLARWCAASGLRMPMAGSR